MFSFLTSAKKKALAIKATEKIQRQAIRLEDEGNSGVGGEHIIKHENSFSAAKAAFAPNKESLIKRNKLSNELKRRYSEEHSRARMEI